MRLLRIRHEIARDLRRTKQRIDLGAAIEALVGLETYLRRELEIDTAGDLPAQKFLVPLERSQDAVHVLAAERHDIDGRELEIRAHAHVGTVTTCPSSTGSLTAPRRKKIGQEYGG